MTPTWVRVLLPVTPSQPPLPLLLLGLKRRPPCHDAEGSPGSESCYFYVRRRRHFQPQPPSACARDVETTAISTSSCCRRLPFLFVAALPFYRGVLLRLHLPPPCCSRRPRPNRLVERSLRNCRHCTGRPPPRWRGCLPSCARAKLAPLVICDAPPLPCQQPLGYCRAIAALSAAPWGCGGVAANRAEVSVSSKTGRFFGTAASRSVVVSAGL